MGENTVIAKREMTTIEDRAVYDEADRRVNSALEGKYSTPEMRRQMTVKEYENITGCAFPEIGEKAYVKLENQERVAEITQKYILLYKPADNSHDFSKGDHNLLPYPTPSAPMPTHPRHGSDEISI